MEDCPNLREWGCPAEGISGNERIIDVGGEPYMHDTKSYWVLNLIMRKFLKKLDLKNLMH